MNPPSRNLVAMVATRTMAVRQKPSPLMKNLFHQSFCSLRAFHQWTHMDNWDKLKVMKTLMEKRTIRKSTLPRDKSKRRIEMVPINRTPLTRTNWWERLAKRRGSQESTARLESTLGP